MRLPSTAALLAAAAALTAGPGFAQQALPGDPVAGRAFVRENCSECHAVEREPDEMSAFYGPPFVEIAASPGLTAMRLRDFLRTPHIEMPDFILSEQEIDDIASYILWLRQAAD